MSAATVSSLLRRAGEWLVEPDPAGSAPHSAPLTIVPPRRYPLVGVVGLAHKCGATTLARAVAAELATRAGGAAVVASPARPAVVPLGSSAPAARLAEALDPLEERRAAGRLCLAACADADVLAAATREVAPAVMEVEPGSAATRAARVLDRIVLVASPKLEPALAAAVAETLAVVAEPPLIVVNRTADHGPWLVHADALVPDSRVGARLALAGREPRGWLGQAVEQLADLCAPG
jgi:hypothetical protein